LPIELDDFTLDSGEAVDIGLEYDEKDYFNLQTASVVLMLYRDIPSCTENSAEVDNCDLHPLHIEGRIGKFPYTGVLNSPKKFCGVLSLVGVR